MAGPWEQYQQQQRTAPEDAGPWSQYAATSQVNQDQEQPGLIKRAMNLFTGADRQTRATRELPEVSVSGILSDADWSQVAKIAPVLATLSDPGEIGQILTENFPQIGITYDEKGNMIANNNKTGVSAVINKPGWSMQDTIQAIGIGSLFTPAGAVRGGAQIGARQVALTGTERAGQIALQSGLTSAGIQEAQRQAGGDFDLNEVLIDTAAAGALEAIPAILRASSARKAGVAEDALRAAEAAETGRIGQQLSPEAQQAQQNELLETIASGAQAKRPGEQLRTLAGDVSPDVETVRAAERLGVEDVLLPSQVSRNPQYIEIEQGLASIPGSKLSAQIKESYRQVAQKADDLIADFGGTTDKAGLSERIKGQIDTTIKDLDTAASQIYDDIAQTIPKTERVDMSGLRQTLQQDAADLGGEQFLDPLERRLLKLAEGDVTYALLDRERKKIGQALRQASGPYKDADSGALKRLYGQLTEAQEQTANSLDASEMWNTAKGLVAQRKQLEDNSLLLLGKDRAGAIMPKVGQAVKRLSTGDYKAFDQTMAALPPEVRQEAVISALNDAFTQGSRAQQQLSVPGFVDWYEGLLRNKAAKGRIDRYLPEGAGERLDDLFKVAKGMRTASQERITTGRIAGLLDNFAEPDGMIARLYQVGRRVAAAEGVATGAGVPGAGVASVMADAAARSKREPLTRAADDLLSSPQFQAAARAYAGAGVRAQQKRAAADKALQASERYQKWVSLLPSDEAREVGRVGLMVYLSGRENAETER